MEQLNNVAKQREFERLAEPTKRHAYLMALRRTGNRDEAEDLMQEAYLHAYRSFDKYNREKPFENWFSRILSNLFVDQLRHRRNLKILSLSQQFNNGNDEDDDMMIEIPDQKSNPELAIISEVVDDRLLSALKAMPKDFRNAVLLCDVDEMSYAEVAETTGWPIGTVRSRIHRGRLLLRTLMGVEDAKTRRHFSIAA